METILAIMKPLVLCLLIALSVGYFTFLERKVLGYIQLRKGVNKVSMLGLPQPLADAVKLFLKENPQLNISNKMIYILSPMMAMVVMFSLWSLYISSFGLTFFCFGLLFFICVSSLNVYTILLSGWSSNSKYALLGSIRAVAQTISYEVSMALILMLLIGFSLTFDLYLISPHNLPMMNLMFLFPLFIMWMITSLAETNRAPFDLAEGESELVSGFNVEYGGGEFAFLFIAEYGSILMMSVMTEILFLFSFMQSIGLLVILMSTCISFAFLWVRASYPRMRYDYLMSLTWKTFLSVILSMMMISYPFFTLYEENMLFYS